MSSFWSSLTGKASKSSSSSNSSNSSSNGSNSSQAAPSAEDTLSSAQAILQRNGFSLSLLPPRSDTEGWKEIQAAYGLSVPQIFALKKHLDTQNQPSPQKAKVETVDEDFSLSPAAALKDCLQFTPVVTVLESLIGPGNCLFTLLPPGAGITRTSIEAVVNFHRDALRALTIKPDIDIELLLIIRLYTIQSPIAFYQYVNKVLNNPDRVGLENIAPFMRLLIRALYAMEDAGYGYWGQAYRGVTIGNSAALRSKYDNHETVFRPESLITFASFSSVTRESRQAQYFGEEYGSIFFNLLIVRGVDISCVIMFPEEAEILVIPPAVFRVGGSCRIYGKLTVPLTHVEQATACYLTRALAVVDVS
jgi:hypothetical protein